MRAELAALYEEHLTSMKLKCAKHKGRFSVTLDEWKSGNSYDFLGMTLHFHNENFILEKWAIGFEVLKKNVSYPGEELYERLDNVLNEYDIKHRVISITRGNASLITTMVGFYKDDVNALASKLNKTKRDNLRLDVFVITDVEWSYIKLTRDVLEAFSVPTMMLQASNTETSNLTLPLIFKLLEKLEAWKLNGSLFGYLTEGIKDACDKLLDYYPIHDQNIDSMKDLYLATVLDPRLKVDWFIENNFSYGATDAIRTYFHEVYTRYEEELEKDTRRKKQRTEIRAESTAALTKHFNIFLTPSQSFVLRIYRMAKDYLSIMAMSVPSQSSFSQMKDTVPDKRNRLLPSMIKILAVLQSENIVPNEKDTDFDTWDDYSDMGESSETILAFNSYDEEISHCTQRVVNIDLLDDEEDPFEIESQAETSYSYFRDATIRPN
ncbi:hypothetical protein JCM33374_g1371 [Metschnikowia sp. JCM 33374]|nr:hypothetical protein JCM33374_g1371 [Metschnikowia sp. JCM 33374]